MAYAALPLSVPSPQTPGVTRALPALQAQATLGLGIPFRGLDATLHCLRLVRWTPGASVPPLSMGAQRLRPHPRAGGNVPVASREEEAIPDTLFSAWR